MLEIANEGPVKTFSYWRLKLLENKFQLHTKLNRYLEKEANKCDVKDWNTVTKVDTHVHLAAAMTRQHLLTFISTKAANFPDVLSLFDRLWILIYCLGIGVRAKIEKRISTRSINKAQSDQATIDSRGVGRRGSSPPSPLPQIDC